MEKNPELNKELKEEVNMTFADLSKEIGNNRQQLANKVLEVHREINRELSRNKVDAKRKMEILAEVSKVVKMAAQQLPHLKMNAPKPVATTPKPAAAPPKPVVIQKPKASIPAKKKK